MRSATCSVDKKSLDDAFFVISVTQYPYRKLSSTSQLYNLFKAQLQENLAEYEAKMNKFKMTNEEKRVKDKEYWDAWFTVYKVR